MSSEDSFPLSIVIECRATYASTFKPSDKLMDICDSALRSTWKERTQLAEWKVTDRYGKALKLDLALSDSGVTRQDTIYLSKKLGDVSDQGLLVRIEDKIEQKV